MKHAIKLSTVILASIFAVVACEKEQAPEAEYQPGETITITATLPSVPATDPATKVDFTQGTNKVDLAWSTGDALTIIGEDTSESQTFTLSGISGSKANFTGTAVSGSSFTVLYPGTVTSVAAMDAKSFTGQTQTGNESLAHLTGAWTAKVTGLSDFSDVKFAAPAGGSFAQSGILKFHIQVPDVVTTVKGVGIEAPSAVFYTDNASTKATSLDMTLSGVTLDSKHAFTAYMALSQKSSDAVAASGVITVKFVDSYDNTWKKDITLTQEFVLQAGKVNVITLDKSAWTSTGRYAGGTGIDGDPWLITEPIHMQHMAADLVSGETKYFKMMADVDMSGETWTPLNNASPFDKAVNFDGNGKKISNMSAPLFADLNGTVKDLTINAADVTLSATGGILANTVNTSASVVSGITVTGSTLSPAPETADPAQYYGILAGEVLTGSSFDDCHIINSEVTLKGTTAAYVGMAFGHVNNVSAKIGDTIGCTVESSTLNSGNYAAGFISSLDAGTVSNNVVSCEVTGSSTISTFIANMKEGTLTANTVSGSVSGKQNIGGLVGNANTGTFTANATSVAITGTNYYLGGLIGTLKGGIVDNCHASGNITQTGGSNYSRTGGLVGQMEGGTVRNGCYYSTGTINVKGQYAGGLVGFLSNGTVQDSYANTTIITTQNSAGGLIGDFEPGDGEIHTLQSCHAIVTISTSGSYFYGGLIGIVNNKVQVKKCYANVDLKAKADGKLANCGGIIGQILAASNLTVENSYATGSFGDSTYRTRRWNGGILGNTASGAAITVTNCYSSFTITSANIGLEGALVGNNGSTTLTSTGYIGWSSLANMAGAGNAVATTGNYLGMEDSILSQAKKFTAPNNWDFDTIWNEVNPPTLK